ncbi:MAG: hypothetical protein KC621_08965 [Myxococcales bacterium]|nr:hypothetical protein [Myxococcales bacterium]
MGAILGSVMTVGWVLLWFGVMIGAVWQILRGRSGAGACLGGAAILGLGLQLCGGMFDSVTAPIGAAAGMQVAFSVRAFLIGCGDAFVLFLMMLGVIVQRPAPE